MKKLIVLLILSISIISCTKKDDPLLEEQAADGYYKVYVDGALESEATPTATVSMVNGTIGTGNNIDFMIHIFNVPEIGQTEDISYVAWVNAAGGENNEPMVKISGDNILEDTPQEYYMFSGSITRDSKFKTTFTGIFKELLIDEPTTYHGRRSSCRISY